MDSIQTTQSARGLRRRTSVETIKAGVGALGSLRKKSSQSNISVNSGSSSSSNNYSSSSSQGPSHPSIWNRARTHSHTIARPHSPQSITSSRPPYTPSIRSFRSYTVSSPTTPPISPPRRSSRAHSSASTYTPDPFSATARNSWFSPELNI